MEITNDQDILVSTVVKIGKREVKYTPMGRPSVVLAKPVRWYRNMGMGIFSIDRDFPVIT